MPETTFDLIQEIKAGNRKAFDFFYRDYRSRLYATLLFLSNDANLAEDLLQETFLKLWMHREKLRTGTSLTGYVSAIARNLFLDHQRKREVSTSYLRQLSEPSGWGVTEQVCHDELSELVFSSISRFSKDKQDMFIRSRFQGETYQEIALAKNTTPKAVERHIAKISAALRQYLRKHDYLVLFMLYTHIHL